MFKTASLELSLVDVLQSYQQFDFSRSVRMLNTCFLLLVIGQVIFGQQNSITDNLFGGRNSSLLKKFEIVTKAPLQSLGAFVNCGEGADRGVHRCVPYYDCDPINNIINELEAPQNGSGLIDIRYVYSCICVKFLEDVVSELEAIAASII